MNFWMNQIGVSRQADNLTLIVSLSSSTETVSSPRLSPARNRATVMRARNRHQLCN